jgi:hypothetical protein
VLEVLHERVGAREEQRFVTVVLPTHAVRRAIVGSLGLEDLAIPVRLTESVALDHDAISDPCSHGALLRWFTSIVVPHRVPR